MLVCEVRCAVCTGLWAAVCGHRSPVNCDKPTIGPIGIEPETWGQYLSIQKNVIIHVLDNDNEKPGVIWA